MKDQIQYTVLIAGGAGFLGSHIAKRFHQAGYSVTVIDGLLGHTGGNEKNLYPILGEVQLHKIDIREIDSLVNVVRESHVVVDCMAWTAHRSALQDPLYDLRLNLESHLHLLKHLHRDQKIIYLGSRSQYGTPDTDVIVEDTPMIPVDIQGTHKTAAESYFRVYSRLRGLNVISLRFPNCFGINQPLDGEDVGLVGGFIRDLLMRRLVEVYGAQRKRSLVYAPDLAEVVLLLSQSPLIGFSAYNMAGTEIYIKSLVEKLIELMGHGAYQLREMPVDISSIDVGNASFNNGKLRAVIGNVPVTDLQLALQTTIDYFKENLR
ncbi:MAG: NAD(P)-dependent oxidoreductase [Chloroflexota bacterium]